MYTWTDGELITADKLNDSESRVIHITKSGDEYSSDKTFDQIMAMVGDGEIPVAEYDGTYFTMQYASSFNINFLSISFEDPSYITGLIIDIFANGDVAYGEDRRSASGDAYK